MARKVRAARTRVVCKLLRLTVLHSWLSKVLTRLLAGMQSSLLSVESSAAPQDVKWKRRDF